MTLKLAVAPASTLWLLGCVVIAGEIGVTVRVAPVLVTAAAAFVTVTVNDAPLSDANTVAGVV